MKITSLSSAYRKIIIQIQRAIDHAYRKAVGLPQAKRSMITPYVYLGGQYGIKALGDMERIGITSIVSMRETNPASERLTKFKVLHLPTRDLTAPELVDLQKGVAFMTDQVKNGGKTYVHCHYGEGRGATMVIAYLMSTGMTYDDAFALVQKVRTFISPTPSQVARLKEFEQSLKTSPST